MEQELQHLTASYGQLKAAQARFRTCIEAIDTVQPESNTKEILVPLTSSLYVPGKLADTKKVLVDVGTGYYVERVCSAYVFSLKSRLHRSISQSTQDARKMYEGRVEYVAKSLETLQETITRKEDNMRVVRDVMLVVSTPANISALVRSDNLFFFCRKHLSSNRQKVQEQR